MTPRLLEHYRKTIVPELSKKFGYKNALQAPVFKKIVINMGIGAGAQDIKFVEQGVADMGAIAGQKPVITRAKKAIANFKIRQGLHRVQGYVERKQDVRISGQASKCSAAQNTGLQRHVP